MKKTTVISNISNGEGAYSSHLKVLPDAKCFYY